MRNTKKISRKLCTVRNCNKAEKLIGMIFKIILFFVGLTVLAPAMPYVMAAMVFVWIFKPKKK